MKTHISVSLKNQLGILSIPVIWYNRVMSYLKDKQHSSVDLYYKKPVWVNPLNFLFWLRGLFDILNLKISLVSSIHVDETLSPCLLWTLNFCLITRRERNFLRVISAKRRTRREDLRRVLLPHDSGEFCRPLVSPVLVL